MIKFLLKQNKNSRAFTLVETMVAISIFTLAVTALMAALASGISNTTFAKQKMTATYLAQEGIEYVRNMRDSDVLGGSTGWSSFVTNLTSTYPFCADSSKSCGFSFLNSSFVDCSTSDQCKLKINNAGSYDIGNSGGVDSGFTRKINITNVTANEKKVTSTVTWGSSPEHSIGFSENLFNWTEI